MWIVDKKSVLTKCGKEWIKLLTMQLWCQAYEKEVYIFPWTNNLSFHQPQVEEAIQTLCQDEPFYSSIIEQELSNEEKIKELMKENEFQKKELQEKDKLLKEAYKELEKYKKREENKSFDDIDYYDDEKDEDDNEDYIPEDIEMDDDNDY